MAERSVGTRLKIGTDYVAGLTDIPAPEKTRETLETTTLDSDGGYRTYTGGFKDGGEMTITGYFEAGDAGQSVMDDALESGDPVDFEVIFPAHLGGGWTGRGIVTKYSAGSATLDELLSFEATIKVTGKPVRTYTASAGLSALSLTGTGGTLAPTFDSGKYAYAFSGVSATGVTVTATAANHALKLYVDGVYSQTLTTAVASLSIPLTLNVGKKLTIVAQEEGKTPVVYDILALKTS